MVKLRTDNTFDETLYDEIYDVLDNLVSSWKTQDFIPKSAFISCINLSDFLAGGSRFYSDEVTEKVEDASNAINELIAQLENY